MPTFQRADEEICDKVAAVMERYHGPKYEAEVVVNVVMARPNADDNGDSIGHAITVGGYPALAKIRILGLKDRVAYDYDAEMVIDADNWECLSDLQQDALIDHELQHMELMVDDKGGVKRDDAGRPRLRMRKHDVQFGAFDAVAHRHGEAAPEVMQIREWLDSDTYKQCYLPGMEPEEARR